MDFMDIAINLAKKAYKLKEIPVGALIIQGNKIISKAYNTREHSQQAINHAEIIAIKKACKKLKSWRLNECEMYVTLEPCAMCAGAILNSRIKKVHIACLDKNHGAVVSKYNILTDGTLNHKSEIIIGEHEQEASMLLKNFFKEIRNR